MKKNLSIKAIICLFVIWRLGLFVIDWLSLKFIPFTPSFPFYDVLEKFAPPFFWQWANFDGVHYIMIAEHGYQSIYSGITQAFFPFFPLTIKFFNFLIGNYLFSGLILANVFFLLSLLLFQRLLKKLNVNNYYPLVLLVLSPVSYYFVSVYNESLFLLLSLGAFLMMENKKWFTSALFISVACATRITGIFLVIPLIYYYFYNRANKIKALAIFFVSILGFLLYCLYLYINFNDPFYFVTVQAKFGASRTTDKLILFYQVIWRYIKMFLTVEKRSLLFYIISQEFILSMLALGLLIWGWLKNFKKPYLIYCLLAFFLPTLAGNLSSMPRYVSVLFPLYIIIARLKNTKLKKFILFSSTVLLIINTFLFLRGFWVS